MTIIYVTENNCECFGVTLQNKGWIKVQKPEDISDDKKIIYKVNPMETFLGKSQLCDMTEFSGARDKEVFDGNTILLEISEENDKHRHIYIGSDMICSFLTNDQNYKYISNMGNNLTPYSIAIGWENIYFQTPHFRFVEKKKIHQGDDVELFDNMSNSQIHSFKKLGVYKIHSNYD